MSETVYDRIARLIEERGTNARAVSLAIGMSETAIGKTLRTRTNKPSSTMLRGLAKYFGVSEAWILEGENAEKTDPSPQLTPAPITPPPREAMPNDIPVMGTAAGSLARGAFQFEGGIIDYVRRTPGIASARDVYALYVEGTSMEPEFRPGALIFVHPHKPPRFGDAVVVQSRNSEHSEMEATIGIYLRKTERYIVLGKHNPQAEIEILRNAETRIHKVLTSNELYGM